MTSEEIHVTLYRDLCDALGADNVFDRSSEILPSVEIHPEFIRQAITFLKVSRAADYLDSIQAADLLGYTGPVSDRSIVPWASMYPEPHIKIKDEAASESTEEKIMPRIFLMQYQLFSFDNNEHYILKSMLPFENPAVDSIDDMFGNANWLEREIWDLLGINFMNSRDLRRLLLPENWKGHPLRRDYVQEDTYAGMSTSRPSPLDEITEAAVENVKKWTDEL